MASYVVDVLLDNAALMAELSAMREQLRDLEADRRGSLRTEYLLRDIRANLHQECPAPVDYLALALIQTALCIVVYWLPTLLISLGTFFRVSVSYLCLARNLVTARSVFWAATATVALFSIPMSLFGIMVRVYTWAFYRVAVCKQAAKARRYKERIKGRTPPVPHLVPESMRAGSTFYFAPIPDGQFLAFDGDPTDPSAKLIGGGYRQQDKLRAPIHVISGATHIACFVTEGKQHVLKSVCPVPDFKESPVSDVCVAPYVQSALPHLRSVDVSPLYADQIVGHLASGHPTDNASTGVVKHSELFGYLEYAGSTRPGFSGCLLMNGKKAVGMHVGGGRANLAVDLSYLEKLSLYYVPETEEFFIQNIVEKGYFDRAIKRKVAPDVWSIKHRGKYYFIDDDTYEEAERVNSELRVGKRRRGRELQYYDPEGDVAEQQPENPPRASGNPFLLDAGMRPQGPALGSQMACYAEQPVMPGPTEEQLQLLRPSVSIQESQKQPLPPIPPRMNRPSTVPQSSTAIRSAAPTSSPNSLTQERRSSTSAPSSTLSISSAQLASALSKISRTLANRSGGMVSVSQIQSIMKDLGLWSLEGYLLSKQERWERLKNALLARASVALET